MGILNKEQEEYIRRFYCPQISAYDFMCLFIAELLERNETAFNREQLMDFICICKKCDKHQELLEDIQIKSNGVFSFSEKLLETFSTLKFVNILYTISPEENGMIYINKSISPSELIISRQQGVEKIQLFISDYEKYLEDREEKKKDLRLMTPKI